uniref:ATP-binding protein n=1 Tax=Candidatus Kentrum sp. FW TaxID=2126338 RepID=A0A450SPV1_9GAMM|nr:MAG: hypothetical protein BECKFW1821B_GA0114236_102515 [Candidatus Kentron sp. FW]
MGEPAVDVLNIPLVDPKAPWNELIERTKDYSGTPFEPETLASLATLKKENPGKFEDLRSRLKKAGCRVTTLDKALKGESKRGNGRGQKQADILIRLAQDAELFHTPDRESFADLQVDGHRETWPVRSRGFRDWIEEKFLGATGSIPNSEALQSALSMVEGRARHNGPEQEVYLRVGSMDGRFYLDLCDSKWRAVEIDTQGWRVVGKSPIRFRRTKGMQSLPEPARNGSIDTLRQFLNVGNDKDFVLVVAWILAVLRDHGPYPALVLSGEQGSAKSTFSRILRSLADPNLAPLRSLPRKDQDLFIAANNAHVLNFDNVSTLQPWLSDMLCQLSTGGGFAVRKLYTDQDEMIFNASRPIILNGIEEFVTRSDLADRAIFLTLEPILDERRQPEKELWERFEVEKPGILGVLLDAVSHGIKHLPDTRLESSPRMADFAKWGAACEGALWEKGTFLAAYTDNRNEAVDTVIETDPVASAIRSMMEGETEWRGTATELLQAIKEKPGAMGYRAGDWPPSPKALSGKVSRVTPSLRKVGIHISRKKEGHERKRVIYITRDPEKAPKQPSASSAPPENDHN